MQEIMNSNPLEACILQAREIEEDKPEIIEHFAYLEVSGTVVCKKGFEEMKDTRGDRLKPSIEDPPILELKELQAHLEYAFLGEGVTLPIIVALNLKKGQKEKLLKVLRRHKKAIAWKIFDIKGISPSFCTHKILMEEDFKPVVQPQRRLNPNMKEVMKAKVIKLFDTGVIYPISDRS